MNRNWLKIIAVLTMAVDHVGYFLLRNNFYMRLIGRLAFPIFAFFIAEGMIYTHSRKKYCLSLLVCAVISQVPYVFLQDFHHLNVLFTFLIAIFCIYMLEEYKNHQISCLIGLILTFFVLAVTELYGVFDYGIFGVLLVLVFYFCKQKWLRLSMGALVLVLLTLYNFILSNFTTWGLIEGASLISILLLMAYNGNKGRLKLKWLFYIFYPLHLVLILILRETIVFPIF